MGRFLTLLMMMILGAMAVRTQQPSPYMTKGMRNGVVWRASSYDAKIAWVAGAQDAYMQGVFLMKLGGGCVYKVPHWFDNKSTARGVITEMDSLYEDGVNIIMPLINAYELSEMKLGGATKEQLDKYRIAILSK